MVPRKISSGRYKSFSQLIHEKYIYVDKTKFACMLAEQEECYLLTRPRRMGKSTMVSTLEYLFSKGTVGTEGLYCHEHWPLNERFFVFHFAFNEIECLSFDAFKENLLQLFNNYAEYFGIELSRDIALNQTFKKLIECSLEKLSDDNFLAQHTELLDNVRPLNKDSVVLLIDEYDVPLADTLENKELFERIRSFYRVFFSTLKNMSCVRYQFLTGVSSYAQTNIFSGANQFKNISLNDEYATCCGYTQDEIERYFAPELDRATQVLKLSYDELMEKLRYFYDGYLFTKIDASDNDSKKIFSPVSVSSFLTSPTNGFQNYWSTTGGQSTFFLKLIKQCSTLVRTELLRKLYPDVFKELENCDPQMMDYVDAWLPFFTLNLNENVLVEDEGMLLTIGTDSLILKLNNLDIITTNNAIAILYQSGYLGIKRIDGQIAYLGLANFEVANSLAYMLTESLVGTDMDQYALSNTFKTLYFYSKQIFEALHDGGEKLASYLDLIVNTAPDDLFAPHNREKVVTFIIFLAMKYSGIASAREVQYVSGRADLVIYKPNLRALVEDVVIEFKLARQGENILTKLAEGTKQVIDKRYGLSVENPNPYRYCVVFSNDLRQVGAIEAINADGTSKTVYVSDKLNEDGTVNSQLLPSKE